MDLVFVTLFDSGYLSRGMVMYESLLSVCDQFKLYIIAFDEMAYKTLCSYNLKNTIIIPLTVFEDDELLSVKNSRSRGEYCWTSTPKSILYIFEKYNEDICTYIDADLFFFSTPQVLIDELKDNDVLITEHRYSDYCNQEKSAGKYCVQFMTFRNTNNSANILKWWKERCLENCGHDIEKGICGDQKYLDDWMERFEGVHELNNIGGGVAPWNVNQYAFFLKDDILFMEELATEKIEKVIFYHLHGLVFFDKNVVRLTSQRYIIPNTAVIHIYGKYFRSSDYIKQKYGLDKSPTFFNEQHFRDEPNNLIKEKNYYLINEFL